MNDCQEDFKQPSEYFKEFNLLESDIQFVFSRNIDDEYGKPWNNKVERFFIFKDAIYIYNIYVRDCSHGEKGNDIWSEFYKNEGYVDFIDINKASSEIKED